MITSSPLLIASHLWIKLLVSIAPVISFLVVLVFLDSYKLVRLRSVLLAVGAGVLSALLCYVINVRLQPVIAWDFDTYSRYMAPIVEEGVKSLYLILLIRARRTGFLIDAGIYGFAIGAGFAILENTFFAHALPEASLIVWMLRGFGTAIMHGGATALFGIIAQSQAGQERAAWLRRFVLPLLLASVIHSLFNHFIISPALTVLGLMIGLPLVMIGIFRMSERSLRSWLGVGMDAEAELLELINGGQAMQSRIGGYLRSLQGQLPGEVLVDVLCLLKLHLELSVRAKGILLLREEGFEIPRDPEIAEKFTELKHLERSVGRTGRLAVAPVLRWSRRDLWQLYMLNRK